MTDLLYDFEGTRYLVGQLIARPIGILVLSHNPYLVSYLKVDLSSMLIGLPSVPVLGLCHIALRYLPRAVETAH